MSEVEALRERHDADLLPALRSRMAACERSLRQPDSVPGLQARISVLGSLQVELKVAIDDNQLQRAAWRKEKARRGGWSRLANWIDIDVNDPAASLLSSGLEACEALEKDLQALEPLAQRMKRQLDSR